MFTNSIVVELWLLHSCPLMNSHFHFLIVELSVSQVLLQQPEQMIGRAWSEHSTEMAAVTDMCCVAWHCRAEG